MRRPRLPSVDAFELDDRRIDELIDERFEDWCEFVAVENRRARVGANAADRRLQGLCNSCNEPALPDSSVCATHLDRRREETRRRYWRLHVERTTDGGYAVVCGREVIAERVTRTAALDALRAIERDTQ